MLYGTRAGVAGASSLLLTQATVGVADEPDANDRFGLEITTGDLDGNGRDDLVVGAPFEFFGGATAAGALHVLYGTARGLVTAGSQLLTQNSSGIADTAESGDLFGRSLSSADLDRDGCADLVVGVPGEDFGGLADAGVVEVLHGTGRGVTTSASQMISEATPGLTGPAEADSGFGRPGTGITWLPGTTDVI